MALDKSLARGLYRQEIRETEGLLGGRSSDRFDAWFCEASYHLLRRSGTIPTASFRKLARQAAAYRCGPAEHMHHLVSAILPGQSARSMVEASFRMRPYPDRLGRFVAPTVYLLLRKHGYVHAMRPAMLVHSEHACRRYLQRSGEVTIERPDLAGAIADSYAMTGAFAFMSHFVRPSGTYRRSGFSVPFRDGLFLCDLGRYVTAPEAKRAQPGRLESLLLDPADMTHPFLLAGGKHRHVAAKTFVGPRELRPAQKVMARELAAILDAAAAPLALLGRLDGRFHPRQDPGLEESLADARGELDRVAGDVWKVISHPRLSGEFMNSRIQELHPLERKPSELLEDGMRAAEALEARRPDGAPGNGAAWCLPGFGAPIGSPVPWLPQLAAGNGPAEGRLDRNLLAAETSMSAPLPVPGM